MFIFHKLIYKSNAFAIKKGKENENQQGEGTPMLRLPYQGGGKSGSVCWSSNQGPGFQ